MGQQPDLGTGMIQSISSSGPQFSAYYDPTHRTDFTTGSTGKLTITPSASAGSGGTISLNGYGSGTNSGTATHTLAVNSSGNIIETPIVTSQVIAQDELLRSGTNSSSPISISDTTTLPKAVDTFSVYRIRVYVGATGGTNSSVGDQIFINFKCGTSSSATPITSYTSTDFSSTAYFDAIIEVSYNTADGWIVKAHSDGVASTGGPLTPVSNTFLEIPGVPSASFDPTAVTPTIWFTYQQATATSGQSAKFKHMTVELLHK